MKIIHLITLLIIITSCNDRNSFCNKHNYEKSEIIKHKLDSLFKLDNKPVIIEQFVRVAELEDILKVDGRKTDLSALVKSNESGSKDDSCTFSLLALEFIKTENYLKRNENDKIITGFIPILIVDTRGNIINYKLLIKYDDGSKAYFTGSEFDLAPVIDYKKLNISKRIRDQEIAEYKKIQEQKAKENKRLKRERIEKTRKTEEAKRIQNEKALKKIKKDFRVLYNSLMAFKDKSDFHAYGFGIGYKYNKWSKDVQYLGSTPEAKLLLGQGVFVNLKSLGLEYMNSRGKETEYSIWLKEIISERMQE